MSYVLCAPVVSQIGLIGSVPPEGLWEPWCDLDPDRWDGGSSGIGSVSAHCSNMYGQISAELTGDVTESFEEFFYWSYNAAERLDLRGLRVWTRLEAPDIPAPLAEVGIQFRGIGSSDFESANPPSYIAVANIRLRRNDQTGDAELDWFVQSVGWVESGSIAAVPATAQWIAFSVSPDGETWTVERSDDCSEWEVLTVFSPGVPDRSLFTSTVITVYGGIDETPPGEIVQAGAIWRVGQIYIQSLSPGVAPEPTPPEATP